MTAPPRARRGGTVAGAILCAVAARGIRAAEVDLLELLRSGWEPARCVGAPPPADHVARGDANGDGRVDLADAVAILAHLFQGRPLARPAEADVDADGRLTIGDAIRVLEDLFGGEPDSAAQAPWPARYLAPWVPASTRLRLWCAPAGGGGEACVLRFAPAPLGDADLLVTRPGVPPRPLPEGDAATAGGPVFDPRRGLVYLRVPATGWIEIGMADGGADRASAARRGGGGLEPPEAWWLTLVGGPGVRARLVHRPGDARLCGEPWGGLHGAGPSRPAATRYVPALHEYAATGLCGAYCFRWETFLAVTNVACRPAEVRVTLAGACQPPLDPPGPPREVSLGAVPAGGTTCARVGRLMWLAGRTRLYCAEGAYIGLSETGRFRGLLRIDARDAETGSPAPVLATGVIAAMTGGGLRMAEIPGFGAEDGAGPMTIPVPPVPEGGELWLLAASPGGADGHRIAVEGIGGAVELQPLDPDGDEAIPAPGDTRPVAVWRLANPRDPAAVVIRREDPPATDAPRALRAWILAEGPTGLFPVAAARPASSFAIPLGAGEPEAVLLTNLGARDLPLRIEVDAPSGVPPAARGETIPAGGAIVLRAGEMGVVPGATLRIAAPCPCASLSALTLASSEAFGVDDPEYRDLDAYPLDGVRIAPPPAPCARIRIEWEEAGRGGGDPAVPLGGTAEIRLAIPRDLDRDLGIVCDGPPGAVLARIRGTGVDIPEFRRTLRIPVPPGGLTEEAWLEILAVARSGADGDAVVEVRCGGPETDAPAAGRLCITVLPGGTRISGLFRPTPTGPLQDITWIRKVLRSDPCLLVCLLREFDEGTIWGKGVLEPAGADVPPVGGNPVGDRFWLPIGPAALPYSTAPVEGIAVRVGPPPVPGGRGLIVSDEADVDVLDRIRVDELRVAAPGGREAEGWSYDPFWDDPVLKPRDGGTGYRAEAVRRAAEGADEAMIRYRLSRDARMGRVEVRREGFLGGEVVEMASAGTSAGPNAVPWRIDREAPGWYAVRVEIEGSALLGDVDARRTEARYRIVRERWAFAHDVRADEPVPVDGMEEETFEVGVGLAVALPMAVASSGSTLFAVGGTLFGAGTSYVVSKANLGDGIIEGWAERHRWEVVAKRWEEGYREIPALCGSFRWTDCYTCDSAGRPVSRGRLSPFDLFGAEGFGAPVAAQLRDGSLLDFHLVVLRGVPPAEGILVTWSDFVWPGWAPGVEPSGGP